MKFLIILQYENLLYNYGIMRKHTYICMYEYNLFTYLQI